MLVPGSRTIAPIPFSTIKRRAFSILALRSSTEMGTALPGKGFSAAMDGADDDAAPRWPWTADGSP